MNDVFELLFCPVHGALGWLLLCWPCAFFALRKLFIFFVDNVQQHAKSSNNRKEINQ